MSDRQVLRGLADVAVASPLLALAAVALAAGLPLGFIAATLAWAGHVAFDRAIGLRLRSPDGFQRGANASTTCSTSEPL